MSGVGDSSRLSPSDGLGCFVGAGEDSMVGAMVGGSGVGSFPPPFLLVGCGVLGALVSLACSVGAGDGALVERLGGMVGSGVNTVGKAVGSLVASVVGSGVFLPFLVGAGVAPSTLGAIVGSSVMSIVGVDSPLGG